MRKLFLIGVAALATSSLSCSSSSNGPGGDTVTQDVGPEETTINVGDATVHFPAGALAIKKTITITVVDEAAPEGYVSLSKRVKCAPTGTDFAQPVTMQMRFNDDGQNKATVLWSSAISPAFTDVHGKANGDGTMSADVEHFSEGFVGYKK